MMLFSSCGNSYFREPTADALLRDVMCDFGIADGYLYVRDALAEHPLTDAMLERMFLGASLEDLRYVKSMAAYLSGRLCEKEIIVIELFDMSHRKALTSLLTKRADLKDGALVYAQGNYVYLLCTERNDEILAFLREKIK